MQLIYLNSQWKVALFFLNDKSSNTREKQRKIKSALSLELFYRKSVAWVLKKISRKVMKNKYC